MQSRWSGIVIGFGVLASAGVASAAEKGQIGVSLEAFPSRHTDDAMLGRGLETGFGLSIQAGERVSLRPSFAIGHALNGISFDVGLTAVRHFPLTGRLMPYVGAGLLYHHRDPFPAEKVSFGEIFPVPPGLAQTPTDWSRRYLTLRTVGGVELRLKRRLSLFGEVTLDYDTGRLYEARSDNWRRLPALRARPVVGLTFNFR
jgi:hypothetical protein